MTPEALDRLDERARRVSRLLVAELEKRIAGIAPDRRFDPFIDQILDASDQLVADGVEIRYPAEIPHPFLPTAGRPGVCGVYGCALLEPEHEGWTE